MLSTSVSFSVLATTLLLPLLLGGLRRRWAYSLGAFLMALAALALASHTIEGQWAGMYFRNCGAAIFNVTLALYILDHIKRQDLTRAEPIRLSLSTFSWMTGPALGVWLYVGFGPWGPQIAVVASLALLMAVFWYIRLSEFGEPETLRTLFLLLTVGRLKMKARPAPEVTVAPSANGFGPGGPNRILSGRPKRRRQFR